MRTMLVSVGCALLFASCAPVTPDARINANPTLYGKLSEKEKALVREGRIEKGMSPEAVFLAWGKPAREYEGHERGKSTMRWDYEGATPVYGSGWGGYYGYGPYGMRPYYGYAMGPEITYVPYRRASVWFENRRVTSWERAR